MVIDLGNEAANDQIHVSIQRDNKEIYSDYVPKGAQNVTLAGQTGKGAVVYTIVVNFSEGWEQTVNF